jgi:hypothetical protein
MIDDISLCDPLVDCLELQEAQARRLTEVLFTNTDGLLKVFHITDGILRGLLKRSDRLKNKCHKSVQKVYNYPSQKQASLKFQSSVRTNVRTYKQKAFI